MNSPEAFLEKFGREVGITAAGNRPTIATAASLRTKVFSPLKMVAPGFLPEGMTILGGKPKIGKSWMMLDAGLAVASGTCWLDPAPCEAGDVLYLALEDNERRLQSRMTKLRGYSSEWPTAFQYATEWPRADDGGLDHIENWIEAQKKPRLVVIDVMAMFRKLHDNKQNPYEADYAATKGLQGLASRHRLAIVGVTHLRKGGDEVDPFEKISGPLGLSGGADTGMILDRNSSGTTLYGRGRDTEEVEKVVEFDKGACRWRLLGDAAEVFRSDQRSQILQLLLDSPGFLSPGEIAAGTGMARNNVDQLLFHMVQAGEITREKRGKYSHPAKSTPPYDPR